MTQQAPEKSVAPAAPVEALASASLAETKPEPQYLTVWFDEKGDLKFEAKGFSIYMIVAVLRAATLRFEAVLAGNQPRVEAPVAHAAPDASAAVMSAKN